MISLIGSSTVTIPVWSGLLFIKRTVSSILALSTLAAKHARGARLDNRPAALDLQAQQAERVQTAAADEFVTELIPILQAIRGTTRSLSMPSHEH